MAFDKEIEDKITGLMKVYTDAEISLVKRIENMQSRGNVITYQKQILESVRQELKILEEYSKKVVKGLIDSGVTEGINQTYEEFRSANIDTSKSASNTVVMNGLVENASGQISDAFGVVGRQVEDSVRSIGIQATTQRMAQGEALRFMKNELMTVFVTQGILSIPDKNGRQMNLKSYVAMVARTTPREAVNAGMMKQMDDMGRDLVKMDITSMCCKICAIYQNRVYSVSGNDKRFPPLNNVAGFKSGYKTVHPNCTHVLMPYIEEFDDDLNGTVDSSNRPFKLTLEDEKMIERYDKDQKIKSKRRQDRKEYEALLKLSEKAPKSFGAYRAIKRANGEKYQELKNVLKEEKKNIKNKNEKVV